MINNLNTYLQFYISDFKQPPSDWESFNKDEYRNVLKEANKYLDLENRYFFPKINNVFHFGTDKGERLILMAKESGYEGDHRSYAQDGSHRIEPGRVVFFVKEDGRINSGRMLESALRAMFEKEGLNLSDYTFESPAPPIRDIKPYRPPDSIRRPGDPAYLWDQPPSRTEKIRKKENSDRIAAGSKSFHMLPWVIGIAIVGILLLWFVIHRSHDHKAPP